MRFWISWQQPTEDDRPLTFPPNAAVLGQWCSGQSGAADPGEPGGYWTEVALVEAENEEAARAVVLKDWPEAENWRFCIERAADWIPGDRFPVEGWIAERIKVPEAVRR